MHDILIVGVPLFVILAGILLNRADFRRLEDKMDGRFEALRTEMDTRFEALRSEMDRRFETLRAEISARFDVVEAELRYFHKQEGRHEARLDKLEKQ